MSVGINYRQNISVGNSVAFLRFSGSDSCSFLDWKSNFKRKGNAPMKPMIRFFYLNGLGIMHMNIQIREL
jgi:hypothetical protein